MAERVELRGHTLRWLVSRIDRSRPYYLLGEVEIADGREPALAGRLDSVDTYNPASYRGGILRLHYARAAELGPWLDRLAVRGEVVVQFWLKPGEAAVSLGPGEEPEVERIPAQLWKFLGGATVLKTSGLALLGRLPRGLGLEYRVQEGLILNFRFGQQADGGFLGCVADNRFVAKLSARPPMQKEGRRTRQQKTPPEQGRSVWPVSIGLGYPINPQHSRASVKQHRENLRPKPPMSVS